MWRVIILFISTIGLAISVIWSIDFSLVKADNAFHFMLAPICGFLLLYQISFIIAERCVQLAAIIECLGQNTLCIMMLHFLAFKLVSLVYVIVYGLPSYQIAAFPTLNANYFWGIAYLTVGLFLPLLASLAWKNIAQIIRGDILRK
jgi:fucose 4-O-acetylase-like acetyltransferase